MTTEQQTRRRSSQGPSGAAATAPADSAGPIPLAQQAASFAKIAQEARQRCERDGDAEQQLKNRKNSSGQ